jgi:uncharacterized protein (DUF169 family)
MDAATLNGHLEKHLRAHTFPLGIKSIKPGEPLPEKVKRLKSDFSGRGDCADIVIKGKKTGEPQVILPCYGDRIFGMTADDEMAFTFPFTMGEEMVEGLEKTHAGGVRYPVPIYLRFQAEFPMSYQELEKLWAERK